MSASDFQNAFDFSGRRVLVTGGGRGIGRTIVQAFLELQAQVIVLEKNPDLCEKLRKELPEVEVVEIDITQWDKIDAAVSSVLPIHHLVNNAGVGGVMPFLDIDLNRYNSVMDVNFKGALKVSQAVAKGMINNGISNGTIVNISSVLDSSGGFGPGSTMYCASKAALGMLTKIMALELAPYGIRVNYIRSGACNTDMLKGHGEEIQAKNVGPANERMVLTGGPIEPEEVAKSVVFLSSSLASVVTGTAVSVDGGFSIF